jgi:murein L,D-transpeptidase YafK
MKPLAVICLLCCVSLASCEEKPAPAMMIDYSIPAGPPRATAAAANVRPALERDLTKLGLKFGDPVFIRAFKEEGELELFIRPKIEEGDGQVPEGFYFVPPEAMKPDSQFHLAFNIGYPNEFDRSLGRTGTAIMVHGNQVSIGCLAMTDAKIEEIYTLCAAAHSGGQAFFRVHIFPFRMTTERIDSRAAFLWKDFWLNLMEGYDLFEKNRVPPEVSVADGRYQFD